MSMIEKKLLDKEPELKTVCDAMDSHETWTYHNEEIALLQDKLLTLVKSAHAKDFLFENNNIKKLITILSYSFSSYFYSLIHEIDEHYPGFACCYLMEWANNHENKMSRLNIVRFKILQKKNLLKTIVPPMRIRLITQILSDLIDDKDNDDDFTNYPQSSYIPPQTSLEWYVLELGGFIDELVKNEKVKSIESSDSVKEDNEATSSVRDRSNELKELRELFIDRLQKVKGYVNSTDDTEDEENEDDDDIYKFVEDTDSHIKVCSDSELKKSEELSSSSMNDEFSEIRKHLAEKESEVVQSMFEEEFLVAAYDEPEETSITIFSSSDEDDDEGEEEDDAPIIIEEPINYEWVTEKSIQKVDYSDYIEETAKKIKKVLKSITREKPGLKVKDFSIFEELNEKCSNFKPVTDFYHGSFLLNQSKAADSDHVVPIPVLIIGDPGIGKTYYSKLLAKLLNTTSYFIDANSISASWVLSGSSAGWNNSKPGLIFKHLNECETVSPIIIFDEMDKLTGEKNYDPFSTFHQLLEKENATNFVDEFLDLEFDASHIIYILSANNLDNIPESLLSRMKVFHIQRPSFKDSMKIAQSLYQKLLGKSPIFTEQLSQENCALLAEYTPREMKQILMASLYSQVTRVSGTTNNNLELRLLPQSLSNPNKIDNRIHDNLMNLPQDMNKDKGYLH